MNFFLNSSTRRERSKEAARTIRLAPFLSLSLLSHSLLCTHTLSFTHSLTLIFHLLPDLRSPKQTRPTPAPAAAAAVPLSARGFRETERSSPTAKAPPSFAPLSARTGPPSSSSPSSSAPPSSFPSIASARSTDGIVRGERKPIEPSPLGGGGGGGGGAGGGQGAGGANKMQDAARTLAMMKAKTEERRKRKEELRRKREQQKEQKRNALDSRLNVFMALVAKMEPMFQVGVLTLSFFLPPFLTHSFAFSPSHSLTLSLSLSHRPYLKKSNTNTS